MASLHYLKNTNYSGLLFAGRLADILGRKKLFLVGLVLYGLLAIITGVLRVGLLDDIKLINRIELDLVLLALYQVWACPYPPRLVLGSLGPTLDMSRQER